MGEVMQEELFISRVESKTGGKRMSLPFTRFSHRQLGIHLNLHYGALGALEGLDSKKVTTYQRLHPARPHTGDDSTQVALDLGTDQRSS